MSKWWFACMACLGGGVALGWLAKPAPAAPEPSPTPRPMVCAERPLVLQPSRPAEEANLAHEWCLGRLEALQAQQSATLNHWPEDREYSEGELPEAWTAAMEQVFEDCDLHAEHVLTDCSEPPCVAALRIDDAESFTTALEGCATFTEAFPDPEVGAVPMSVRCPDGSADMMVLLTTFDREQRRAYFSDLGFDPLLEADLIDPLSEGYRIMGRRADALTRFWDCEGAQPAP
ncbi:MAG: hypothetical protein KTR31_12005 [Myxococcales bacterium]|nr:hypothetical protein [Myxococcales bacterium]